MVICGDTLSVKKPNPAVIQHCLDTLGVAQGEALFVGDSSIDMATAKAAGVCAGRYRMVTTLVARLKRHYLIASCQIFVMCRIFLGTVNHSLKKFLILIKNPLEETPWP
jgi:hypothetical protein